MKPRTDGRFEPWESATLIVRAWIRDFIWIAGALLLSTTYSILALWNVNSPIDQLVAIFFCIVALTFFIAITRKSLQSNDSEPFFRDLGRITLLTMAFHLGILMGFALMQAPDARLWVFDSYHLHLPSAINVANILEGREQFRGFHTPADRLYVTQIFVGVFFFFFGVNPITSGIAILIAKLGAVFMTGMLGREIAGRKAGLIAAAAYAFLPTITFYTIVFYKEAFIHLFAVSLHFIQIRTAKNGLSALRVVMMAILLLMIANERFYLFPLFLAGTYWAVIANPRVSKRITVIFTALTGTMIAGFIFHFSDQINFREIFGEITRFKNEYNAYPDVDKRWNAELPYPLGILKLYLSPYFGLRKFDLFSNYSLILIWASFLSQALLLGAAIEIASRIWREGISFIRQYGFLFVPFIGFMLVFGYVAPFAGRLRDTFIPLLAVYFAAILIRLFSPTSKPAL